MLVMTAGDGSPLGALPGNIERGVDSSHVSIRITNPGATDVVGAFLTMYAEKTPGMLDWQSSGHPAVDERWGRFQLTAIGGATAGQEQVPDGVQPMGHLATAMLPTIRHGDWIIADVWLRQNATSACGGAVNWKLEVAGDSPATAVPRGLTDAAWGVLLGLHQSRSALISGGVVTATMVNDDQVHASARAWMLDGLEYRNTAVEDITLDQNDSAAAALATGESYYATLSAGTTTTLTVTKGLKSSGTPTKPSVPAGELFVAFVHVRYGSGGSVIASGDIDSDLSYWRYLAVAPATGLSVVVHPGEGLAAGFMLHHAVRETVLLTASVSNWIWAEYGGAITATLTSAPPSPGAIPLWLAVTSGSAVTSLTDLRPFVGQGIVASRGGGSSELVMEEEITLDTGAAFTDSLQDLLLANALELAVCWAVTEAVTGPPTGMTIGDASTADRFDGHAAPLAITAGASGVGLDQWNTFDASPGPAVQVVAGKLRITLDDVPTGGKVLVQVHQKVFRAPTA